MKRHSGIFSKTDEIVLLCLFAPYSLLVELVLLQLSCFCSRKMSLSLPRR